MVPFISSRHVGKLWSTEHLMDYLFTRPNSEIIDCFSKHTTYQQNINRYHKLKNIPCGRIPAEIDFLVEVYTAWNKPTMSQAQFVEVQRAVENFPAAELQKVKSKLDLKNLRSELAKLNMNDKFMKILARKYNLKYTQSELVENSTPDKKHISNVKQSGSCSTSNNQNISNVKQSGSYSTSNNQNISNVKTSESNSTPGKKHITHVKSSKYLLLNGVSDSTNPNKFILKNSLETKQNLFQMFGININELEGNLTKIFRPLTEFLGLLDKKFQGQFKQENNLDFVLRLFVRMSEIFSSKYGPCLESGTLIRCPYYFKAEVFSVEVSKNIFIISAKQNFDIPGYSMKRFQFELILS